MAHFSSSGRRARPWLLGSFADASTQPFGAACSGSTRGIVLLAQAFVADPQGPVLGLALTAGQRLAIGD